MDFFIFLFLVVALATPIVIYQTAQTKKKREKIEDLFANLPNFVCTYRYIGAGFEHGLAIDEANAKICLFIKTADALSHRVLNHSDIFSSELFEDGDSITKTVRSSQIGGAVVGGILLGGVGMVIGGLSGKKVSEGTINRIDLRLIVNDSQMPVHDVCFMATKVPKNGAFYRTCAEEARKWQARMEVLIKRAEREASQQLQQNTSSQIILSDEIKKLADLRTAGILTEEEFQVQKIRLLA